MTTATLAPLTTFTAPVCRWQERYLDVRPPYKLANTFTRVQCDLLVMWWAGVETVQVEMENQFAGERALANMAGMDAGLWLADERDVMDWYGYPYIGDWADLPDVWGALYRKAKEGWESE